MQGSEPGEHPGRPVTWAPATCVRRIPAGTGTSLPSPPSPRPGQTRPMGHHMPSPASRGPTGHEAPGSPALGRVACPVPAGGHMSRQRARRAGFAGHRRSLRAGAVAPCRRRRQVPSTGAVSTWSLRGPGRARRTVMTACLVRAISPPGGRHSRPHGPGRARRGPALGRPQVKPHPQPYLVPGRLLPDSRLRFDGTPFHAVPGGQSPVPPGKPAPELAIVHSRGRSGELLRSSKVARL